MITVEVFHDRSRKKAPSGHVTFLHEDKPSSFWQNDESVALVTNLDELLDEDRLKGCESCIVEMRDDAASLDFLKDITFLTDVFLLFEEETGKLRKCKFIGGKELIGRLKKLQQMRMENESGKGKRVIVLTVDTKLKKWQTIDPCDTIASRLGFGNSLFQVLKKYYLYQIFSCFGAGLFITSHLALGVPMVRGDYDQELYLITSLNVTIWALFNLLLSNFMIVKAIVRSFLFWYLVVFSVLAMFGFMNAFFCDVRALFLCSTLLGLVMYVGLIDAAHPSFRKRYRQVTFTLFGSVFINSAMLVNCYFFPDNLEKPVNTVPLISWQLGPDPENLTHMYGLSLALDCTGMVVFWILWLAIHMSRHPDETLLFCPDIRMKFIQPLEYVTYEARVEGRAQRSYRQSKVQNLFAPTVKIKAGMISKQCVLSKVGNTLFLHIEDCAGTANQQTTMNTLWKRITENLSCEFSMHFQRSFKTSAILSQAERNKAPSRLLTLDGPFVDQVFVVDSRDTLGRAIFGERVANRYHKFCAKTKWMAFTSVLAAFASSFCTIHMFSETLRAQFPDIDWLYYSNGVMGALLGANSIFFLNASLCSFLICIFETYFQSYLISLAFILDVYLLGTPRCMVAFGGWCSYMSTVAFGDAVHPATKLTWLGFFGDAMVFISFAVGAVVRLFSPQTLAEPLQRTAILSLAGDMELSIYSTWAPKFVLSFIWVCYNTWANAMRPGALRTIKARLVFSRNYLDYQTRSTQVKPIF